MAKEQTPEQEPTPAPAPAAEGADAQAPPKSYRLFIAIGLAALILFQVGTMVIVLWFMVPPKQPLFAGIDPVRGVRGFDDASTAPPIIIPVVPEIEIELQKDPFNIRIFRSENEGTDVVTLRVHVTVRKREEGAFTKQFQSYTHRVIQRVEQVLNESSRADLEESGHTAIMERMKREINEVLGTPWVQQILLTEYNHTVQ
jgi:flagellar basal body-associated protein FliL